MDVDEQGYLKNNAEISAKEIKGLVAWSGGHLKKRDFTVDQLEQFADGVLLINLLELCFKCDLGRYTARPKLAVQKLENISIASEFMVRDKIFILGVDSHAIERKDVKQTVVVLWNILRHVLMRGLNFSGDDAGDGSGSFRDKLLGWVKNNFPQLKMHDFWDSWKDGIAFCHIVDSLCPGKCGILKDLDPANWQQNLNRAFDTAHAELGIPRLLEPNELQTGKPKEKQVINYVSMLLSAAQSASQQAVQEAERDAIAKRLKDMELDSKKIQAEKERLDLEREAAEKEREALRIRMEAESEMNAAEKEAMAKEFSELQRQMEKARLEQEQLAALAASQGRNNADLEAENAALRKERNELRSELYKSFFELEEVVKRVREDKAVNLLTERSDGNTTRDRSYTNKLAATIREAHSAQEYLDEMTIKEGTLLRRRPNAMFNSKRYKPVTFALKGNNLMYKRSNGVMNGVFDLKLYKACKLEVFKEDGVTSSSSSGKPGVMDEPLVPRMLFKLVPKDELAAKVKKNMLIELQSDPLDEQDPRDNNSHIKNWVWEINRRIAILNYLAQLEGSSGDAACRELLDYVTDDKSETLSIKDKVVSRLAFDALAPALMQRHNLRNVVLVNVEMSDDILEVVSEVIISNDRVKSLSVKGNQLSARGMKFLAAALKVNKSLTKLDLSNNKLKDEGVKELCSILQHHTTLIEINFANNGVTDAGVKAFVDAALQSEKANKEIHELPSLNFSYNLVGNPGCEHLARLIKANATVTSLNLESNSVGDAGAMALAEVCGKQMTQLLLGSNDIAADGMGALGKAIQKSNGELLVDLSDNKLISRKGYQKLFESEAKMEFVLLRIRSLASEDKERGSIVQWQQRRTTQFKERSDMQAPKMKLGQSRPTTMLDMTTVNLPDLSESEESDSASESE